MKNIRLTELLDIPFDELNSTESLRNELIDFYKLIYGVKACTSCKQNITKMYNKLMTDGVQRLIEMESATPSSNFKLRSDVTTEIVFDGGLISTSYVDDETVLKFLAANPNRISLFEVYPDDWKQLIQQNNDTDNASE